jgi:hypothetical protein
MNAFMFEIKVTNLGPGIYVYDETLAQVLCMSVYGSQQILAPLLIDTNEDISGEM